MEKKLVNQVERRDIIMLNNGNYYLVLNKHHSKIAQSQPVITLEVRNFFDNKPNNLRFNQHDEVFLPQIKKMRLQFLRSDSQEVIFYSIEELKEITIPKTEILKKMKWNENSYIVYFDEDNKIPLKLKLKNEEIKLI